jgi:peptide/nickel transport system substrate-binding protein
LHRTNASRWKRIGVTAAAASLIIGLTGCGAGTDGTPDETNAATGPQVLVVAHNTPPTSLDPARSATFGPTFLNLIYESLLKRDVDGNLGPGLATEWELSDDAQELTLTLREGVTFQDGAVFDAEAVKANLDFAPERGGDITKQLSVIDSVEVVDDTHVKIALNRPAADILGMLASEAGMMISPEHLGAEDLGTNPVGTGPFMLDSFNQTGVNYAKWEDYWDADRVKLDRIEYRTGLDDAARLNAVLTGEADMGTSMRYTQIPEVEERGGGDILTVTHPAAFVYGLMLNTARANLDNPDVRLALQHAINKAGIADALFGGDGCEAVAQPFPTSYWASDPALEKLPEAKYDPDAARKLLEDAGLVGQPIQLYVGATTVFQNMAAAVQEQLNAVGFNVTVEVIEPAELSKLRADGEFEASIASVQTGRPDPAQFVRQFYLSDGIFNPGGTTYSGIEVPLFQMNTTTDQDQRAEYMHEINKQIIEQGPTMIPICSAQVVNFTAKDVKGLVLPVNYDFDLSTVYFDPAR